MDVFRDERGISISQASRLCAAIDERVSAFDATRQSCRIHWRRTALARAPGEQRTAVAAMLEAVLAQETEVEADAQR